MRVVAANNDAQIRIFDAETFASLNRFSFDWSVNVSASLRKAALDFYVCTFLCTYFLYVCVLFPEYLCKSRWQVACGTWR